MSQNNEKRFIEVFCRWMVFYPKDFEENINDHPEHFGTFLSLVLDAYIEKAWLIERHGDTFEIEYIIEEGDEKRLLTLNLVNIFPPNIH
ncbi:MAG: hypothetical protein IJ875_01120 [Solobacterium sp.]|nr:hypothetical protein [Solobacterium sp.]